jgi:hypothetical protein
VLMAPPFPLEPPVLALPPVLVAAPVPATPPELLTSPPSPVPPLPLEAPPFPAFDGAPPLDSSSLPPHAIHVSGASRTNPKIRTPGILPILA